MIKIATAECFTHGKVAQEIHAFSQGYPQNYNWKLDPAVFEISLVAGMFIPTISGVKNVLKFEPLPPLETINDIKVYNQEGDLEMARSMARAMKKITSSDIGIGTTAGVGKGGIAVCNDKFILSGSSEVETDLRNNNSDLIFKRQESGIKITLKLLECIITGDFKDQASMEIIKINESNHELE